jgi:hypothetical protein
MRWFGACRQERGDNITLTGNNIKVLAAAMGSKAKLYHLTKG